MVGSAATLRDTGGGGLDNVSATTLVGPAMCLMTAVSSAMADNCHRWLSDLGSETRVRAPTNALWSVKTVNRRHSSIGRKCSTLL
jgi:hypothetical protein